jgi:hypothetical protein
VGNEMLDRLGSLIGDAAAAEIAVETFLGPRHQHFSHRQPFILAFMREYADWIGDLTQADVGMRRSVADLSALFNLGIVLVDQIGDDPAGRAALAPIFAYGRLECVPRRAGRLTGDPPSSVAPELRVLTDIVGAFFEGVDRLDASRTRPEARARLLRVLADSYAGQFAVADGARTLSHLRAKSVLPFGVTPALAALAAPEPEYDLPAIGEAVGEVFWRVDDLLDLGRDHAVGDGNVLLDRAGIAPRRGGRRLEALLEDGYIDGIASEIAAHVRAVVELLERRPDVRVKATRWLEMYILDWMR